MVKAIVSSLFLAGGLFTVSNAINITLSPVSVVATGTEEPVLKQPLSISVKNHKEIELDQVIFQKDLFNSLPGVRIEQTGSVFGCKTSIRMPLTTGPYYLFMQDGIPVQSSGFYNHNGLVYTTYSSSSSVEVLKGAGTALYGSDAIAAVIDVKSLKRPSKTKEIKIKTMAGSYGFGSGTVEMSNSINKDSGYRANAKYIHSDGWRDHTNSDRLEANLRYDKSINLNNQLKIIFNASKTKAQQADSFNNYQNILNGSTADSDDPNYFLALQKTNIERKFDYARLSLTWDNYSYDDIDLSLTPYIRYNRNRYVATWEPNLPSNDTKLYTVGFLQRGDFYTPWGRIIAGLDGEFTKASLKYNQDFNITTSGWHPKTYTAGALYDYDVYYSALAPYARAEINLNRKTMLALGLRYDYNHYDYKNHLLPNSYDPSGTYYRPADRTDSFSHLSPKISLSYRPRKDVNLYLRYANGFRIPQATRLYSMKKGYEEVKLNPETSNTYEIGAKKEFGMRGYANLSIYYMNIKDTITRYTDSSTGDRYYDNGGETTHKGIEIGSYTKINDEIGLKIAYSYSRHNYVNDPKFADNEISQAPNNLANLRVFYTPEYLKKLKVMFEYQYIGSYWKDDAHKDGRYKGYKIGNIKAEYKYSKKLKFFTKITNITNERYANEASYAYGKEDYTPGSPRSAYIGFDYKW